MNGENHSETAVGNQQFYTGIPSLNTYLTYNNPFLHQISAQGNTGNLVYYNYSGLQTGYSSIQRLLENNSVLSMLGVKYIEDQVGLLTDGLRFPGDKLGKEPILSLDTVEIPPRGEAPWLIQAYDMPVLPKHFYQVRFYLESETSPELIYIDLYREGNEVYDHPDQNNYFSVKPGKHSYELSIWSGDAEIPENTMLRIVSINEDPITISDLQVEVYDAYYDKETYTPFRHDLSPLYYENSKAKEAF